MRIPCPRALRGAAGSFGVLGVLRKFHNFLSGIPGGVLLKGGVRSARKRTVTTPSTTKYQDSTKKLQKERLKILKKIVYMSANVTFCSTGKNLREISFLLDFHGQVKLGIISGKFKRIIATFAQYQLPGGLEGIDPAKTIFGNDLPGVLVSDDHVQP